MDANYKKKIKEIPQPVMTDYNHTGNTKIDYSLINGVEVKTASFGGRKHILLDGYEYLVNYFDSLGTAEEIPPHYVDDAMNWYYSYDELVIAIRSGKAIFELNESKFYVGSRADMPVRQPIRSSNYNEKEINEFLAHLNGDKPKINWSELGV